MRLKELSPDKYIKSAADWEEVPDEDLWEDGEIDTLEVQHKIIKHTMQIGDWRLIRRIEKWKR